MYKQLLSTPHPRVSTIPKTRGYPRHCDIATFQNRPFGITTALARKHHFTSTSCTLIVTSVFILSRPIIEKQLGELGKIVVLSIHGCTMAAEKSTGKSVMHEPSSCFACFKLSYYCLKLWTFSMPSNIVSDIIGAFYASFQPGPGCSNVGQRQLSNG